MLTFCRGHGSIGEQQFIEEFIMPYNPTLYGDNAKMNATDPVDGTYAYVLQIGDVQSNPVLWSCHVDTVHSKAEPARQVVQYDVGCGLMYKDDNKPLGADDGAGVWLLLEMIDAGVPGTYIFHRGEECGGIGSRGMSTHYPQFVKQYKWAIAFDRKGTVDVITEQYTGETSSVKFAQALADKLGMGYAPCPTGVFTDTANYAGTIPECTNVSVGYDAEHTPNEMLDVWHLCQLRDVLVLQFMNGVDLPFARDPSVAWGAWDTWDTEMFPSMKGGKKKNKKRACDTSHERLPMTADGLVALGFKELVTLVRKTDPYEIADLLLSLADEVMYRTDVSTWEQDEQEKLYDWRNI
jgi:hypothetical protein